MIPEARTCARNYQSNRRRTNLVGKPNTATEEDSADDQHGEILGRAVEDDSHKEEDAGDQHGVLTAEVAGGVGSEEGGSEAGEVERGGKQLKALVVVLAVVAVFGLGLPTVDFGEELDQEVIHGGHAACQHKCAIVVGWMERRLRLIEAQEEMKKGNVCM